MSFSKTKKVSLQLLATASLLSSCYSMQGVLSIIETTGTIKNLTKMVSSARFSSYKIHPSIGIARAGNCDEEGNYYLAPNKIGSLPLEKDGSEVKNFKDKQGRIRRQAAHFKIYQGDKVVPKEEIENILWFTHLANKKAAWWEFNELCGDLLLPGTDKDGRPHNNSYEYWANQVESFPVNQGKAVDKFYPVIAKRNPRISDRKSLVIDYGPRLAVFGNKQGEIFPGGKKAYFNNQPELYAREYNKSLPKFGGDTINTLGMMEVNDEGGLYVLGGHGYAAGEGDIEGFGGGNEWHDDVSDGPVEALVKFKNGHIEHLKSWVVVGSPKYAPELVNITTWSDTILDMAVRYAKDFNLEKEVSHIFNNGRFVLGEKGFYPSFQRDIKPIFERMKNYDWVANVTPMVFFANPPFNVQDNSKDNLENRRTWFQYLRQTCDLTKEVKETMVLDSARQTLFNKGYPLMPLNSGDNSVRNQNISKFVTLSPLQYYMLYQWSEGFFNLEGQNSNFPKFNSLDQASVGNCVGYPMSPGIEVTWTIRNPIIYEKDDPYRIKHKGTIEKYLKGHLDPDRDETDPKNQETGCEPGDLTKRMAIPWQADFANCTVQAVNYTAPKINKEIVKNSDGTYTLEPKKISYYAYWWPAQSPYNIYVNYKSGKEQEQDKHHTGEKVNFQRGIEEKPDSISAMLKGWSHLGFILNNNQNSELKQKYPSFAEHERNFEAFDSKELIQIAKEHTDKNIDKGLSSMIKLESNIQEKDKNYRGGIVHALKKQVPSNLEVNAVDSINEEDKNYNNKAVHSIKKN